MRAVEERVVQRGDVVLVERALVIEEAGGDFGEHVGAIDFHASVQYTSPRLRMGMQNYAR